MKKFILKPNNTCKKLMIASSVCSCFIAQLSTVQAQVTYEPAPTPSYSMQATLPSLPTETRHPSKKIKLALILDTSNSMDGLINQAKSQLWEMVNQLAEARCDNLRPSIEIALYEYGNDRLNSREGFIRQVTPLTQDLDQISEDLFSLTTEGGEEFCGQAIATSLNQLNWSESSEDLQLIFIAGNEPFTQGPINYMNACRKAIQQKVIVNTIFCGSFNEGINTSWKNGATFTGGEYMSIDHNSKTVYVASPYDKKIASLNEALNETYLYYGAKGAESKRKQESQDKNASSYGLQNKVSRTLTKTKHIYKNSEWDLVDAAESNDFEMEKLDESTLNEEMKVMSTAERQQYIKQKTAERKEIQSKIAALAAKREAYIASQTTRNKEDKNLNRALISVVTKQAQEKRFVF